MLSWDADSRYANGAEVLRALRLIPAWSAPDAGLSKPWEIARKSEPRSKVPTSLTADGHQRLVQKRDHPGKLAGNEGQTIIAGRYRLVELIGMAGAARFYAAYDEVLARNVMIHLLMPISDFDDTAVLLREARVAARLTSRHVVLVLDVLVLESGTYCMVTEPLEGCSVATLVVRNGSLPVEQAVDFVRQACSGIAEAHRLGVIHRDLKPANLYAIGRSSDAYRIKVAGFGLCKTRSPMMSTQDNGPELAGTMAYMSPEQWKEVAHGESKSGAIDQRADIWALGITLYELLNGKLPFERMPPRILSDQPLRLSYGSCQLPASLAVVISKCLERNPDERYRNADELAMALGQSC